MKYPVGIVDDLPVVIRGLTVTVDFVIMDMPKDSHTPIILGRPFMATASMIIDVKEGKLSLKVGEQKVVFDLKESMKFPPEKPSCHSLESEEEKIFEDGAVSLLYKDPIDEIFDVDEPMELDAVGYKMPKPPLSYPPGFACVAQKERKMKKTPNPDPGGKPKTSKKVERDEATKNEPPDSRIKREIETILLEPRPMTEETGKGGSPDQGLQHFRPP